MIKEIDLNNEIELQEGNVYIVTRFNRNVRPGRDPLFKLGNKLNKKCLFSTMYTKTYLKTDYHFGEWKNEILVSCEYNDNFFEHEVFQQENIYIVCQFHRIDLNTNIQDQLIKIAKDKKSIIVLKGCDLLDVDSHKNKEKLNKYLVRGKTITKEEMYKAMGLFLNSDNTLNLTFNIEEDDLFGTRTTSRRKFLYDPEIIQKHIAENHKAYGMCGANDFDHEYELEPNKCHVPLRYLDPPIARLCKIIGAMGFRTMYSCVGHENETIFSFKSGQRIKQLFSVLNQFQSELVYFELEFNSENWIRSIAITIKQKRPEFIIDDAYFWELQRLGDFLQAQVGVNFPLSFQSSYRPQSN